MLGDLATCDDDHRMLSSRRRVDRSYIGVGVWAPNAGLDRAGEGEIVDVTPLTGYCAASH